MKKLLCTLFMMFLLICYVFPQVETKKPLCVVKFDRTRLESVTLHENGTEVHVNCFSPMACISSKTVLWYVNKNNEKVELPLLGLGVSTFGSRTHTYSDWQIAKPDKMYEYPYFVLCFDSIPMGISEINVEEKIRKGFAWNEIQITPRKLQPSIPNVDSLIAKCGSNPYFGIYEFVGDEPHNENDGQKYKIAFIENQEKPVLVYLECMDNEDGHIDDWFYGNLKADLKRTAVDNVFTADWYNLDKSKSRGMVSFENGVMMKVVINGKEDTYIKISDSDNGKSNSVRTNSDSQLKSTGSGFIISDNVVATNYHVVDEANKIKVALTVNNEIKEYDAELLVSDKTNDLALLKIVNTEFSPLPPAPYRLANNTVDIGTSVFAMGYPLSDVLGQEVKVTDGIISSKTGYQGDITEYQISVPIQPGNSGGALFDKKGNLVGITNAGISASVADNVGYAIKSSYLLNLIDASPKKIQLPSGKNLTNQSLPSMVKMYSPYVVCIKIY